MVLCHHSPGRTAEQIDAMVADLGDPGVAVLAAYEGLAL